MLCAYGREWITQKTRNEQNSRSTLKDPGTDKHGDKGNQHSTNEDELTHSKGTVSANQLLAFVFRGDTVDHA